jgi:hypothetical protein
VKFIPRHNQIIGRIVIKRMLSTIVRPDETKNTTKFVLVDAVGPDAAAAGLKIGDVVLPNVMSNIFLDGGAVYRPLVDEKSVACVVADVTLDELAVQNDGATKFVTLDDPEAAQSLGTNPPPPQSRQMTEAELDSALRRHVPALTGEPV